MVSKNVFYIAILIGIISVFYPFVKILGTSLKIITSFSAKRICHSVFLLDRKVGLEKPYIEELSPISYFVNVKVEKELNFVETSSIFDNYFFSIKSQAYFTDFGCILHKNITGYTRKNEQKLSEPLKTAPVSKEIKTLINKQFKNKKLKTDAIILSVNGSILYEKYDRGYHEHSLHLGWSMSKSIVNALIGIRIRQGKLSLTDKILAKDWSNSPNDTRNQLNVDQLLRMSSGLNFWENYNFPTSDALKMLFLSESAASAASQSSLEHPIDSFWYYSSGTSNLLSRKLRETFTDDQEYWNFAKNELFDKLGMNSKSICETDTTGDIVGSSFCFLTPKDWLKFGILYLNDGIYNNQRILPENWVNYTFTPTPASNGKYGAHFWLNGNIGFASGFEEQKVFVVREHNLVLVRLGLTKSKWDDIGFIRELISKLK